MVFSQQCTLQWSTDLQCVHSLQCTVQHCTALYSTVHCRGDMCPRVGGGNVRSQAPPRPLVQPLCAMVTPEEACQFDLHQTPTQFISFWTIYAIPMSKCPIASYIIFVCFNFLLPLILFIQFFAIPVIKPLVSSVFQSLLSNSLSFFCIPPMLSYDSLYSIPVHLLSCRSPSPLIILERPCWWRGGEQGTVIWIWSVLSWLTPLSRISPAGRSVPL